MLINLIIINKIMSMIELFEIGETKKYPADPSKIEKRTLKPKTLEISLLRSDLSSVGIYLNLQFENQQSRETNNLHWAQQIQTSIYLGNISDAEALRKYEDVLAKIDKGHYKLIWHDNGKLEFELL